jgi:hypothetical protein
MKKGFPIWRAFFVFYIQILKSIANKQIASKKSIGSNI